MMDNHSIVSNVTGVLKDLGLKFKVCRKRKTSPTIGHILKGALGEEKLDAVVVTARHLIEDYDPVHPERIACILYTWKGKQIQFSVIVNNRQCSVPNQAKFHVNRDYAADVCAVCLKKCEAVHPCTQCSCVTCDRCDKKLCTNERTARKCPGCRTWRLTGDIYGTPFESLNATYTNSNLPYKEAKKEDGDPFVTLSRVLNRMDGEIIVIPRVGQKLLVEEACSFCRLSGTNRYSPTTLSKIPNICKKMKNLHSRMHQDRLTMLVIRFTYGIDAVEENPICEMSLFSVDDGALACIHEDSWNLERIPFFIATYFTLAKKTWTF
jgi:hypothetical protein